MELTDEPLLEVRDAILRRRVAGAVCKSYPKSFISILWTSLSLGYPDLQNVLNVPWCSELKSGAEINASELEEAEFQESCFLLFFLISFVDTLTHLHVT